MNYVKISSGHKTFNKKNHLQLNNRLNFWNTYWKYPKQIREIVRFHPSFSYKLDHLVDFVSNRFKNFISIIGLNQLIGSLSKQSVYAASFYPSSYLNLLIVGGENNAGAGLR